MSRAGNTWGHAIALIGSGGLETLKWMSCVRREVRQVPHWDQREHAGELVWSPYCSAPRCPEKPEYATRYLYVTGRAGRMTDRIQYCCRKHGEAFATKHGLTLPLRSAGLGAPEGATAVQAPQLHARSIDSGPESMANHSEAGQSS